MAIEERHWHGRAREAEQLALSREWRRLARAATIVAILIAFRGFMDVLSHRLIPRASLYGAGRELVEDDIVSRRRVWYWRTKFRRLFWLALFVGLLLGVLAIFGMTVNDLAGGIISALPLLLIYGIQLPLLFFGNLLILFGPLLFFGLKQMKGYEPGDADWGVKLADVRGQAEGKEEVK